MGVWGAFTLGVNELCFHFYYMDLPNVLICLKNKPISVRLYCFVFTVKHYFIHKWVLLEKQNNPSNCGISVVPNYAWC